MRKITLALSASLVALSVGAASAGGLTKVQQAALQKAMPGWDSRALNTQFGGKVVSSDNVWVINSIQLDKYDPSESEGRWAREREQEWNRTHGIPLDPARLAINPWELLW